MSAPRAIYRGLLIAWIGWAVSACGSGGAGDAQAPPIPPETSGVVVTGSVSKGPLDTADAELLPIDAFGAASGAAVATATTDSDGRFTATIPPGSGALLVRTSGGSYVDEADREPDPALKRRVILAQGEGLESLLPAGETSMTVSIATQALLDKTRRETVAGTFVQQFAANRALATAAFGFDIVTTEPANPVSPDPAASVAERQYAMALGGFANLVNRITLAAGLPAPTIATIRAAADDFSDGRIDGLIAGAPVTVGNVAIPAFSLNEEIARFRNNNFDAYAGTPLIVIDENVFSQTGIPANVAPVAVADGFALNVGETLTLAAPGVLANDTDADGNPLTAELAGGPAEAAAFTFNADGSFVYTHDGSPGSVVDAFSYRASDGLANSAVVTVTLDVSNRAPVAIDDAVTVDEGGLLSAPSVLNNDSDADPNDTLTARLVDMPAHGLLTFSPDGTFEYTHDGSEIPDDAFSYVANDGSVDSLPATVAITVNLLNDTPVANADSLTVDEGATANALDGGAITVLANDFDEEMAPLIATLENPPANGDLFFVENGTFSYNHNGSETTSDSFSYTVTDGNTTSSPATVTIVINPVNDLPIAADDSLTVDEGATQTLLDSGNASVLANDLDAEMDMLSATVVDPPSSGLLTLNVDGTFSYEHDGSPTLSDGFTYVANDGTGDSNVAGVSITINPVNDAPTTTGIADVDVDEGAAARFIDLFAAFDDEEDNDAALGIVVESNTNPGLVDAFIKGDLALFFSPDGFGVADIAVSATDTGALSVTATFRVTVNGLPLAVNDGGAGFQTSQNVSFVTGDVLLNDDLAEQPATITAFDNPSAQGATVTAAGPGTFDYAPALDFSGLDTFTYTITDANGDSSTAIVTIAVSAAGNQPPTAIDLSGNTVDEELPEGTRVGVFTTTDPDPGDLHAYSLVAGAGDGDNALFQVAGNELQTAVVLDFEQLPSPMLSIRVRTDDQNGGIFEQTFTIIVNDILDVSQWINPNGGSWSDPANWSPPAVPGPFNGALIDMPADNPTITIATGVDVVIQDIDCRERLVIQADASLTVANPPMGIAANIDALVLEPGATLVSSAADLTVFPESLDGGSLLATAAGKISINLDVPVTLTSDSAWRAEGIGSALAMFFSSLEVGIRGQGGAPALLVEALDGGVVDLPNLFTMTVNDSLDGDAREIDILASGPGSQVLLPQLIDFSDADPDPRMPGDGLSSLTALAGGAIGIPQLSQADGVSLGLDAASTVDIAQLTGLRQGVLTVDGGNRAFTNLTDLTGSHIVLQSGASADFSAVNRFDDGKAEAFDGSVIALPSLNQYWVFGDTVWQADGAGSRVDVPNLLFSSIGNLDTDGRATWQVGAFNGGVVSLPTTVDLIVNDSVSPEPRYVELRADGAGSLVDLQELAQFDDQDQDPRDDSCIAELNGGVVNIPPAAQLNGVSPAPCP